MRSVAGLVPDLLAAYPLLLYQGEPLRAAVARHLRAAPPRPAATGPHARARVAPRRPGAAPATRPGALHAPAPRPCLHPASAGMHDAQDGPASSEAWICRLDWDAGAAFATAHRHVVRARDVDAAAAAPAPGSTSSGGGAAGSGGAGPASSRRLQAELQRGEAAPLRVHRQEEAGERGAAGAATEAAGRRVVAYWKRGGGLTHVVLTEAGHMVPRDAPVAARWMLHRWLEEELGWAG